MSLSPPTLQSLTDVRQPIARRPIRFWRVVLLIVLLWGAIASYVTVISPLRERVALRLELGRFADQYFNFQAQQRRSPRDLDELLAFIDLNPQGQQAPFDRAASAIRSGDLIVCWNAQPGSQYRSYHEFLGYESKVPGTGGFVIRASGAVSKLDAWDFKGMTPVPTVNLPDNFPRVGAPSTSTPVAGRP